MKKCHFELQIPNCRGSDSGSNPNSSTLISTSFLDCTPDVLLFFKMSVFKSSILDSRTERRDSMSVFNVVLNLYCPHVCRNCSCRTTKNALSWGVEVLVDRYSKSKVFAPCFIYYFKIINFQPRGVRTMDDQERKNYYSSNKAKLFGELDQILTIGKDTMISAYGQKVADELIPEVHQEFETLIPHIPYIGGDDNPFTVNLVASAKFLALYKVLQRKGIGKNESGILSLKIFGKIIRTRYKALEDMPRSDNGANAARVKRYHLERR